MSHSNCLTQEPVHRLLIVDDNEAIHADFRKTLAGAQKPSQSLQSARAALFDEAAQEPAEPVYRIDSAFQGQDALEIVRSAMQSGEPYAAAFIDVRMPPGWDGVETIERIWAECPELQVVICTAYSDYSWDEVFRKFGRTDRLLILKKPFDTVEVRQLACALTAKWQAQVHARLKLSDLEAMVSERTRQLLTLAEELRDAKSAADHASRAKGDFLANISHEIRTPMTAILGHADLLLDPEQDPSQRLVSVQAIQRNGRHLLELINDILDLSKIESGKLEIESLPCSTEQILADVVSLTEVRATEKGLALLVRCAGQIPEQIQTDPTRLRQILVNLVGNAVKFTSAGQVEVVCRLDSPVNAPQPRLAFDVIDTGIGMTGGQMQRLFQPFVQGDASTTRTFGGTGLGLSISKRLANALGGDITVRSRTDEGTTFTLTIATGPLEGVRLVEIRPGRGEAKSAVSLPQPKVPAAAGPLAGKRILLAEDGPDNQYLIALHLRRAGATVEITDDGLSAVEFTLRAEADGSPFDVVFMDMQMPIMDGYQAVAELRRSAYHGTIIALTAHAMSGDRDRCLQAGCDDYCTKPIEAKRLVAAAARPHLQIAPESVALHGPPESVTGV